MSTKLYTDPYTLDGRIPFTEGVNAKKVEYVKGLYESAMATGNPSAIGKFKEAITTTSDGIGSLVQMLNAVIIPRNDELPRESAKLTGAPRRVETFDKVYLYSLAPKWEAGVVGDGQVNAPQDSLPVVPENTPYPEAVFFGELLEGNNLKKHGLRTGWTWEQIIRDPLGITQQFPSAFLTLAGNTIEKNVFETLVNGTDAAQQLDSGESILGATVPANAPLSVDALDVAWTQLQNQIRANYASQLTGGANLVVGIGHGRAARFIVSGLTPESVQSGNILFGIDSIPDSPTGITVIESPYVEGNAWYLVPKPGTTARPVIERLSLIGHEEAELRISDLTGRRLGGGAIGPLEGSFDVDDVDLRIRLVTGSALWSPNAIVWSTGEGS